METSNTVYLVDLENIGANVLYQHIEWHKNAEYIIFYSDNTQAPGVILENIPDTLPVSFVDCRTGGNNAMDFCICAVAGMISSKASGRIKILSNDKGYDSIFRMLQDNGVRIGRECTYHYESTTDSKDGTQIIAAIKKNVPKQYQERMIKAFQEPVSRKEAHEICQSILPQKIVAETYKKLKKHIPKEVEWGAVGHD